MIPPDDPTLQVRIKDETFDLDYHVQDPQGNNIKIPDELRITEEEALTKLLHRPVLLKIFRENLKLKTQAIENLDQITDPGEIYAAISLMLNYLENDNPYLLTYRFGPKQADAMQQGLEELHRLCAWAMSQGYSIQIIPTRRFFDVATEQDIVQIKQNAFQHWM